MSIRQMIIVNGRKKVAIGTVYLEQIQPFKAGPIGTQNAYAVFASTGGVTGTGVSSFTWLLGGAAADYQIRFQRTAGVVLSGVANNTWLNLGTSRTAYVSVSTSYGVADSYTDVSISYASNSTIITTVTGCWWTAERTA